MGYVFFGYAIFFLYSLGVTPFALRKKRAKVLTSAKFSWLDICVILSEV